MVRLNKRNIKKLGSFLYKKAQEPEDDTEDSSDLPTQEELQKMFQKIIKNVTTMYGKPVVLVNPQVKTEYGSMEQGFEIVGYLKWPEGRPMEILDKFGSLPVKFSVPVVDNEVSSYVFMEQG